MLNFSVIFFLFVFWEEAVITGIYFINMHFCEKLEKEPLGLLGGKGSRELVFVACNAHGTKAFFRDSCF